jgi:hypothetical protein
MLVSPVVHEISVKKSKEDEEAHGELDIACVHYCEIQEQER